MSHLSRLILTHFSSAVPLNRVKGNRLPAGGTGLIQAVIAAAKSGQWRVGCCQVAGKVTGNRAADVGGAPTPR